MRTVLAVLAGVVLVGAVLGSGFSMFGAVALLQQRGELGAVSAPAVFNLVVTTVYRPSAALALGLTILFVLGIDRRARLGLAVETC